MKQAKEDLASALAAALSGGDRFERLGRAPCSPEASVYQIVPLGVIVPKTAADVQAALTICARFGVPLTARGGGTSQAGQSIGSGVIVDFSKYICQLLEENPREGWG